MTITVSTTPQMVGYLDRLVATGLFGKNQAEAAERLISDGVKLHLAEGTLIRPGRLKD